MSLSEDNNLKKVVFMLKSTQNKEY